MRRLSAWLWLAAALALAALSALARGDLPDTYVACRWHTQRVEPAALDRMLESAREPARAAIWNVCRGEAARGLFSAEISVARYHGDARLLTGDVLAGAPGGCAIGEEAARALFGSRDVIGRTVELAGVRYDITCVFGSGQADLLIPWDGASACPCDRMALAFPGAARGAWRDRAVAFAKEGGLPEPDGVFDGALLAALARLEAPGWMIPTRWSDFAAWRQALDGVAERLRETLRAEHAPLDGLLIGRALAALCAQAALALCAIEAAARFVGGVRKRERA